MIDAPPKEQNLKVLAPTSASASIVFPAGSSTGQLLFLRDHSLLAQTFDLRRLAVSGEPVPIADQVDLVTGAVGHFSASSGALVYRNRVSAESQLTWFDPQGKVLGTVGIPASYAGLALSPDGKRLAYADGGALQNSGVWVLDLALRSARFMRDEAACL